MRPAARIPPVHPLLALGGIGPAGTSFVFLFVSEHQPLFGFHEHGFRTAIVVALAAEATAVAALRRVSRRAGPPARLAVVGVDEEHAGDVPEHEEQHEHGDHVHEHGLVVPPAACFGAGRSAGIGGTISRRRRRRPG